MLCNLLFNQIEVTGLSISECGLWSLPDSGKNYSAGFQVLVAVDTGQLSITCV